MVLNLDLVTGWPFRGAGEARDFVKGCRGLYRGSLEIERPSRQTYFLDGGEFSLAPLARII